MADELLKSFQAATDEIQRLIARRRASWRLVSIMEYEDVSSILLAHIWKKWAQYDPAKPLDKWVNKVVSHQLRNLMRNNCFKNSRPCIAATPYGTCCSYNGGGDLCRWTKSGVQDSSCRFFKAWMERKHDKFAVATPLSIENHIDESHSRPDDFFDVERAKAVVDANIKRRLTKEEYRVYVLLYVKHLSMEDARKKLGVKKTDAHYMKTYMRVRSMSEKAKEVTIQIASENGLI